MRQWISCTTPSPTLATTASSQTTAVNQTLTASDTSDHNCDEAPAAKRTYALNQNAIASKARFTTSLTHNKIKTAITIHTSYHALGGWATRGSPKETHCRKSHICKTRHLICKTKTRHLICKKKKTRHLMPTRFDIILVLHSHSLRYEPKSRLGPYAGHSP